MIGLVGRLLELVFIGTCFLSLNFLFLALAGSFRLLPSLFSLLRSGLQALLILSFRLYRLILSKFSPVANRLLGIDVLAGYGLVAASVLISLIFGLSFLLLTSSQVTGWGIGLFALHGLLVGLTWDDIEKPGGLQLGAKIQ